MAHVTDDDTRERFAVRLKPAALVRVRELAAAETEGNVSQMIRKLLAEALDARSKRSVR